MSDLKKYILNFQNLMALHTKEDQILHKTFTTTLRGSTFLWSINLLPHSIISFHNFARKFVTRFIIGVLMKQTSIYLFFIVQTSLENLRDYVTHFNNEALLIQDI